mmetsp:Transcript_23468/g.41538  ORF Transcript_23468/g.41538 Transcript_23468/m.41538 type:complete len:224 (+) Transcript_23468:132-803(+)
MKTDFRQRCENFKKKSKVGSLCMNDAVVALLGAGKDAMSGTTADYFLRLFVRSERIYQDLTLALGLTAFKSGWAIREWVDIDIGMEFRGFIKDRKFCALCQYDYLVKIPELAKDSKNRDKINHKIQSFFKNSVAPALHKQDDFSDYVADFAIDTTGKCWVIELNPFQESTDGAMFSWATEKEKLTQEPLEFRWQSVAQNAGVALSKVWRALLTEVLQDVNNSD